MIVVLALVTLQSPLREPSGLVATSLRDAEGRPLVLAIDDELPRLHLLTAVEGEVRVERTIDLTTPVDDLEALAFDAARGLVYAVASHRRHDEPAEAVIVRRALDADAPEEALHLSPAAIAAALEKVGVAVQRGKRGRLKLDGRAWWRKDEDERHAYAFEIEAAACAGDDLLLGVKVPLAPDGAALVLAVALDALPAPGAPDLGVTLPEGALRALRADLGGHGATAMCVDPATGELWIASNPADKPGRGGATAADAYGRSRLTRFRRASDALEPVGTPHDLGRAGAKLEGLAVVGAEVWLAYDGEDAAIVRRKRADFVR